MAAQGYIVVGPTAAACRSGQEWLDQISGDYSGQNIRDYLCSHRRRGTRTLGRRNPYGLRVVPPARRLLGLLPGRRHERRFGRCLYCGIFDFDSMYLAIR